MAIRTFLVQDPQGVYANQAIQYHIHGTAAHLGQDICSREDKTAIKMLAVERMCECPLGQIRPGVLHDLLADLEVYPCG